VSCGCSDSDSVLEQLWQAVSQDIIDEINNFADIKLALGDLKVLPGTFQDSIPAPITGKGDNEAVTLTGKIE